MFPYIGLPARYDVVKSTGFDQHPEFKVAVESILKGRSFPAERCWGLVELRLVDVSPTIWRDILAEENPDIEEIIDRHISPVIRRLKIAMSSH